MIRLPELQVDRLSFWLGFLAACILWWVVGRVRLILPHWNAQVRGYLNKLRLESLAGVESLLRKETINQAQRQHLSASLFSLDEILIPPLLLAPPFGQDPTNSHSNSQSIASQVIPCIPDWPEALAPFGVPVFTPLQAIQYGRNIAIIGQPGSGKSTAICHLACEISRQESGKNLNLIPVLVHVLDLHLDQKIDEDPLTDIINFFSDRAGVFHSAQIKQFFKSTLQDKQRNVVLLLDGLDELSPAQLSICVDYLKALFTKYPRIQTVVTASADYLDGLTKIGFFPLGIAAWTPGQRIEFSNRWGELWKTHLVPDLKKSASYCEIDPTLYNNWISDETDYLSPLEWTMRIWGAYAGDLSGNSPISILKTQISRHLPDRAYMNALEDIAHTIIQSNNIGLPFTEMENFLTHYKLPKTDPAVSSKKVDQGNDTRFPSQQKKNAEKLRKAATGSLGEQIISGLLTGGILIEHANGQITFSSPVFLGFLAGMRITEDEAKNLICKPYWSATIETLHYASVIHENNTWIYRLIEDPEPPLFHNLLIACRWLRDAPIKADWRSHIMRTLVSLLQNEAIPLSMRLRFITAFYLSRDPSTTKLFKQLLSSQSPTLRRVALVGCGILGNPQLINDVLGRLADHVAEVRFTACLALSVIPIEAATNAIVEIVLSGDEELRQAAAESLALNIKDGHKLLEEAANIEDILTRRAAVFGILQIQQPWARQTLEKMAVEDSQWVVRNAAAQALETLQHFHPTIPRPLPPASEASWLLRFASNLGMGILPGNDAVDVLLMVLNSGSVEEQIAALHYLRNHPSEDVISAIYQLLFGKRDILHEPALYTLWWIDIGGFVLPNPAHYGFV